jgi:dGTP triphosphohydrolase
MAKKGVAELLLQIKTSGEEALSRVGDSLQKLGEIGTIAFGYLSAVVVKAVGEFQEQEEATNSLTRAMVNNGVYSRQLANDYNKQAEELSALSTYAGEQITAAQAVAQQQLGQTKITKELTQTILDFASAQKMDLSSAAEVVSKSIGTGTNALARYGIEVNTAATESQKMTQVIDGLNRKFGGQAEAAAQGLGGLKQLENLVNDLFQALGERLAPVLGVVINYFKSLIPEGDSLNSVLNATVGVFNLLARGAVAVIEIFVGLGQAIGTTVSAGFSAIEAIASGNFSKLKEISAMGWEDIKNIASEKYQKMADTMAAIDSAESSRKLNQLNTDQMNEEASRAAAFERKLVQKEEQRLREEEAQVVADDLALQLLNANEEQKIGILIAAEEKKLQTLTTNREKIAAMENIHNMKVAQANQIARQKEIDAQKKADEEMTKNRQSTLSTISSLQSSSNSHLAAIGKAAALTQIAIETPVAISRALSAFPPPFNFAAAGAVAAAMAAQAARVSGIALAEGGIVMPRPGGTSAIIGEAGQPEAVIPLDRASEFGLGGGGGVSIVVYGGLLGNEQQARDFALAVDKELLNLRRNNESQAFDSGVV